MLRSRLPLIAALLTSAALTAPAAAQAADSPVPCIDLVVVTVNCDPAAPVPPAAEATTCPGRDLVPTSVNLAAVRTATTCLVNEERAKRGLKPLKPAPSLQNVARLYAKRMVKERFFEHTSPDGGTFLTRIKRTSYLKGSWRRWSVGENLAWGTGKLATPEEIVQSWMNSEGHRRNILTAAYTELGMGIAIGAPVRGGASDGGTYVNEFGERRR